MRRFVLGIIAFWMLLLTVGCGGGSSGPVQPQALTPEQEKAIQEDMEKTANEERAAENP